MKTLYYGGKILSMDLPLYSEAMLTEGDRILELGNFSDLRKENPEAELMDIKGACLMPAFIDSHSHFSTMASAKLQISLEGLSSSEEIKAAISEYIKTAAPAAGSWLIARDYDNNLLPGAENPGIEELDSYAPGYKLIIHHKSGHMGLLNSEALKALDIKDSTPSPAGGHIGHSGGKLDGYLEENAFFGALRKLPAADMDALMAGYEAAQREYAENGIGLIQEGMFTREMLPAYRELLERDIIKLPLRIYCSMDSFDDLSLLLSKYSSPASICGIKIYLDGSPQGRTAWMREPYEGSDYRGYGSMTDAQVIAAFKFSAENSLQLIAHCNGDAAAEQFLRCLEISEHDYPKLSALRPCLIHAQLMGTDQLERAKKLGACVSFFLSHVRYWGDVHIKNFGMERAQKISPARSAMEEGLNYTFHQDAPVLKPNMLESVDVAVTRITSSGKVLGEGQELSPLEALRGVTVNAAWQYFEENQRGCLKPGMLADFVLLSEDPLESEDIEKIQVLSLYSSGKKFI